MGILAAKARTAAVFDCQLFAHFGPIVVSNLFVWYLRFEIIYHYLGIYVEIIMFF